MSKVKLKHKLLPRRSRAKKRVNKIYVLITFVIVSLSLAPAILSLSFSKARVVMDQSNVLAL